MRALLSVSRGIDAVTAFVGRWVYWLVLAAVLVSAGNGVSRKLFSISSNAWLELQWYLFGAVFMLAAAYTLQRNEHIRIDIISNLLSKRRRDWIDVIGHVLFLLPLTVVMTVETMTEKITASSFALAKKRMMTKVRIMSPIMETPSRMPEEKATIAVRTVTVTATRPPVWFSTQKLTVSKSRVCATQATKKVRPRMKSMVSRWMRRSRP